MSMMRLRRTRRRCNPSRCPTPVYGLRQSAGHSPWWVSRPRSVASRFMTSPLRYHVCRGIWGVVRHILFYGWFFTSLVAPCLPHPPFQSCPHDPDGVTSATSPWDATPTYPVYAQEVGGL